MFSKIREDICKSRCTTGINDTGGKFASGTAGVVDTCGKFATGVNDTGGAPWAANISANYWKNSKRP